MRDRCYSTLICARPDAGVFEKMGYTIQDGQAITVDGDDIPGAVVMIAEEAENGKYDELTSLQGIPFIVCNDAVRAVSAIISSLPAAGDGITPRRSTRVVTPRSAWIPTEPFSNRKSMMRERIGPCIKTLSRASREPQRRMARTRRTSRPVALTVFFGVLSCIGLWRRSVNELASLREVNHHGTKDETHPDWKQQARATVPQEISGSTRQGGGLHHS